MPFVRLKKPKAILLELTGSLITRQFMTFSEERLDFVRNYITEYFEECYPKKKELRLNIAFFKNQELVEKKENKFDVQCPSIDEPGQKLPLPEVAIAHILYRLSRNDFVPPLTLFILHFNEWSYRRGLYLTPVYPDTRRALESWAAEQIAVYVDAASEQFVDMVLRSTSQGNLLSLICRSVNLMEYELGKSVRNFSKLHKILHIQPQEILVITRFAADARLAIKHGFKVLLLIRDDFEPNWKNTEQKAKQKNNQKKYSQFYVKEKKTCQNEIDSILALDKLKNFANLNNYPSNPSIGIEETSSIPIQSSMGEPGTLVNNTSSNLELTDMNQIEKTEKASMQINKKGKMKEKMGLSNKKKKKIEKKPLQCPVSKLNTLSKTEDGCISMNAINKIAPSSKADGIKQKKTSLLENEIASHIITMCDSIENLKQESVLSNRIEIQEKPLNKNEISITYKDLQQLLYINYLDEVQFI